jgi:hypothetical protein
LVKKAATASTASETAASSTSSINNTHNNEDDKGMQHLTRKLAEIDQEHSQFRTQQQKVEDDVSTLTHAMTKMGVDILNIHHIAKLNQQLHEINMFLKQNIEQAGKIGEPTIKTPPRKRRGNKDNNSFSYNEEICGSWASDCESEEEKRKGQAKGAEGIEYMVVESGILGNM